MQVDSNLLCAHLQTNADELGTAHGLLPEVGARVCVYLLDAMLHDVPIDEKGVPAHKPLSMCAALVAPRKRRIGTQVDETDPSSNAC